MRDIKRIDRICAKLAKLWKEYPDERFGQFMTNHIFNDGRDPFFREDEPSKYWPKDIPTWEELIDEQIKERRLFWRVVKETNYEKDHEQWWKDYSKWMEENPMKWSQEKGEVVFVKKPKTPEPKSPSWRDYIKDLK